ncbi:MAG: hypothetical protein ABI589_00300 [Burkholderiales bacterium]
MHTRALHRASAIALLTFALAHLANHLASLSSVSLHIAFMEVLRHVYRQRVVESLLFLCVAFQVLSGLFMVIRGRKGRHGFIPWLQAASGVYLAFFLLVHVSAVLFGRAVLRLDTNFYFAAAGFHVAPYQYFFAPYYLLGVLALFTHVGCALYWRMPAGSRGPRALAVALPVVFGGIVSLLIVLSLAGLLRPVAVPAEYKATYANTDVQPGHRADVP